MSDMLDLRIDNGTIVDGTGRARYRGSVGVTGGRVVAVGDVTTPASRTIDATDRVVAPGFIDIHTHYDAQVFWDPMITVSPFHGVTTAVMGNCGFGMAPAHPRHHEFLIRTLEKVEGMPFESTMAGLSPYWTFETFPEFLDAISERRPGVNICCLVPHTTLRIYVMGEDADRREATVDEIAEMGRIVEEAMEAGAWGVSTSNHKSHIGYAGRLAASLYASHEEYRALMTAMASTGRGTMETTRGEILTIDAMAQLIRETGRPITLSALMADEEGRGSHVALLEKIEQIQSEGVALWPQVSPRPITLRFTLIRPNMFAHTAPGMVAGGADFLDDLFAQLLDGTTTAEQVSTLKNETFRSALRERTDSAGWNYLWTKTELAEFAGREDLCGRPLNQLAMENGTTPADVLLDIGIESELTAVFAFTYLNGDEIEVAKLLQHDGTRLGVTDGGAHVGELCDACYPTHVLGHWVRDKQELTLERAIHMMTARSASVFGITDRGTLQPGAAADIVVFDPATVAAAPLRRVRDLPLDAERLVSDAIGIEHVIVNGVSLIENGQRVAEDLPGQLLRSMPATTSA